ncbi:NAD(P)/FAD-dependent oxidoreductase [Streptomyces sp. M92]|uniref:NAD(P)/FAD-dependent oxidoreductase n=1 Tax=Streptomyces sp. M92 TaxID=2944250 RepID=UPI00234BCE7B|nr:NAD(P)/FAD-dependent oxidoreductase [Streptomyces sp. M92]WCN03359.1 tryptophan 7-halogenase [Streptomyces sp. M92]
MSEKLRASYDAIVIGGGPGGSTAAATIASQGRSVLLLEKTAFPRFHIGESLLPYVAGLLDRMGLLEKFSENGYVPKRGAEFTDTAGDFWQVDFTTQGPGRHHQTFQVERAHFDNALLEHAREAGADVLIPATVDEVVFEDGRAVGVRYRYKGKPYEIRSTYVVDASGRSGKISHAFGLRRSVDQLRMVAAYRHYTGLDEDVNPGRLGDIQIGNHSEGWVWAIPIRDDTISIGTVMRKETFRQGDREEIFEDHRNRIPRIVERLKGTEALTEVSVETDYCYLSNQVTGPGWFMVGDAGCFVDPIFSSGVFLAMVTGRTAGRKVLEAIENPSLEDAARDAYESFYKTGYDTYFRLIHAFYEFDFDLGKYHDQLPETIERRDMALMLSGDFWSRGNALAEHLRKESRWEVFEPFEPSYGCPVYPELEAASRAEAGS